MNVFRDLNISADAEKMAIAVAEMEQAIPAGWARDKAAETRTLAFPSITKRVTYCFACKKEMRRPAAMLILAQKDPGTFYISNIIPIERHQLEHAEYNSVLEDFYERVFKPYADKSKLAHTVTGADAELERWMDEPTAELLRAFSACANKGTGASHPNDRERWNAFMLAAHRTNSKLDPSTLARWLVEEENWSSEIAEQLALEYESGRGLLAYAFSH
jgi:hypothetical protein